MLNLMRLSDVVIDNIVNTYGDVLICIEAELEYHDKECSDIFTLVYDKEICRTYIIKAVTTSDELIKEINEARNMIVNAGYVVDDASAITRFAVHEYCDKCKNFNFDFLQKKHQYFLHCKDNIYRTLQPGIHFSISHKTYMIVYERYESEEYH
ncbi:hypothetical protein V6O07_23490, partial [Arthrospira platensis SPKY2]